MAITYKKLLSSVGAIASISIAMSLTIGQNTSASDPVTDQVNVTIPVSCSLSGTGMDSHVTSLHNTESDSSIGETTITAYCNDLNGFSIYAVGFTNDEYGNTTLSDSNLASTNNILTGTSTSGATSNWAMKLTPVTSPTPTYPITIVGSTDDTDKTPTTLNYTSFQPVPSEYALVAKRKAATDTGTNAEGSTFKTTYQAYVSPTQNAGTYQGQVKYTLVHPYHNIDDTRPNQYYVVHSGTGEIEVLPLSDDGDLTAKVSSGFLYGGYYKSYGGVSSDAVNNLIAQYESGEVDDLTIDSFTTYTLENMEGLRNAWDAKDAYTEYGTEASIEKGRVYYLKEVPENYLKSNARWIWNGGREITQYYIVFVIDDLNYRKAGYVATPPNEEVTAEAHNSMIVYTQGGGIAQIIRPSDIIASTEYGYVLYRRYDNLLYSAPGETLQKNFASFWVTPDRIRVLGRRIYRATIEDADNDGILDLDEHTYTTFNYKGQITVYTQDSPTPPLELMEN